jgi:hypothetical protein
MSVTRIVYVALALLVAGAVWFFRETGEPGAVDAAAERKSRPLSRQGELLAVRKDVLRQIEKAQRTGVWNADSSLKRQSLADLRAILEEMETELRELEPDAKR